MEIIEGGWKYIDNELLATIKGTKRETLMKRYKSAPYLFNLNEDPKEEVNLYEKHPKIAIKFQGKLRQMTSANYTR